MVDVVFVLLLFFMALAGATQMERHLTAAIPSRGEGVIDIPLVLDLGADGAVSINGLALVAASDANTAGLDQWLTRHRDTIAAETSFVIRPQNDARHERVVGVLNSVQRAGYKKIAFH